MNLFGSDGIIDFDDDQKFVITRLGRIKQYKGYTIGYISMVSTGSIFF